MLQQYMEPEAPKVGNWSLESMISQIEFGDARLDRFEKLCATMEAVDDIINDIETLVENGDANQTTALMIRERIQAVEEDTGMRAEIPSLEDHGDDMIAYHQISMEAVSGFWNRIKQVYVSDFQSFIDGWATLFTGYRRWGLKQQGRIHGLRQEWADKKPSLNEQRHKGSLAGQAVFMPFTVDGRLSKHPVKDMTEDNKTARYLSTDYPKALAMYVEKVRSILNSAKFDSDESFKKSLIDKLAMLEHPSTILKSPIIGQGSVLLHNTGLEIKKGRSVKPVASEPGYKKLADLSVQTHVKEFIFSWSMLNAGILEDFYLTTDEVDKLLDLSENYAKYLVNCAETFRPLQKAMKGMADYAKKSNDVDHLSDVNRRAFRQVISFCRGLTRYAKTPYRVEIGRIQSVCIASRIIASRTIATAK
jgi:hypothetical protein